jgi:quercetin dioxygenase-like cupin family protein
MAMSTIFSADQSETPWAQYGGADGDGNIRFKALTEGVDTATRVQYIEYAPNHSEPVHQHGEGEVFVVAEGELWVNDARNGPGSIICIPRDTDYAVRSGAEGARFFRVVVR